SRASETVRAGAARRVRLSPEANGRSGPGIVKATATVPRSPSKYWSSLKESTYRRRVVPPAPRPHPTFDRGAGSFPRRPGLRNRGATFLHDGGLDGDDRRQGFVEEVPGAALVARGE